MMYCHSFHVDLVPQKCRIKLFHYAIDKETGTALFSHHTLILAIKSHIIRLLA